MTIEEFIDARLSEDEAIAQAAAQRSPEWRASGGRVSGSPFDPPMDEDDDPPWLSWQTIVYDEGYPLADEAVHIARHEPARVLQQCAALRAVLADHRQTERMDCWRCSDEYGDGYLTYPCLTVRALSAIWSTDPDYRQEWTA